MTERMSDERLAELIQMDCQFLFWPSEIIDALKAERQRVQELDGEITAIRKGRTVRVEYDLSPAMKEGAIRGRLIDLGWKTPEEAEAAEAKLEALRDVALEAANYLGAAPPLRPSEKRMAVKLLKALEQTK